jgi:Na+-driven multidrug efflux pump
MRMFTNTESLVALGVRGIRILAAGYIVFAGTQILMGVMRGAGDTAKPMWISLFNTVVLRMPLAYFWAWMTRSDNYPKGSPDSIFASLLITWVVGFLITVMVYRQNGWKKKAITTYKKNLAPKVCLHE